MNPEVLDDLAVLQSHVAGRYSLERELGRGGMGIVYLARDIALDRRIAIKLLPRDLAAQVSFRERFLREARFAARLSHPYIVPIHAVEEHADAVFFVMGYIEGETLGRRIERVGALAPADVSTMLQQVAWALAYAHGRGVVHRDVKPDNILLERATGRAMVMDFGIASAAGGDDGAPGAGRLTEVGHVVGTAAFMSPEQACGEPVDGRSDLYSLGVVGFLALTGRLPFVAATSQGLLAKHVTEPAPPVASLRAGIPAELARTVDRLLAKEPAARFESGESVAEALGVIVTAADAIAPALRSFLRYAEQHFKLFFLVSAIVIIVSVMRPVALWPLIGIGGGTALSSVLGLFARARLLIRLGYRLPDVREALEMDMAYATRRRARLHLA